MHGSMDERAYFRYAERPPHAALTPWIASYWEFTVQDNAPAVHHVPPDGCTSLLMPQGGPHAGALLYSGPWVEPLVVPVVPGQRFVGIRLRPGATDIVLNMPVTQLVNATAPAAMIGGPVGQRFQRDLLALLGPHSDFDRDAMAFDEFWLQERVRFERPDALVSAIVDAIVAAKGEELIGELARAHGCAERTLLRRFRAATGLSPKQFARVRRFLAAAWHAVDGIERWGRVAAEAGFADHAHLHHEVKAMLGKRPEEFGMDLRRTKHERVSRHLPEVG